MDKNPDIAPSRFRTALLQRALQLQGVLQHETAGVQAVTARDVGDFKDAAAEESIACVDEAHAAHAALELQQIQDALARMNDGTWGRCVDCGDPIDIRRLVALPAAAFCTSCQAVHERH